jgi:hypothetical protein
MSQNLQIICLKRRISWHGNICNILRVEWQIDFMNSPPTQLLLAVTRLMVGTHGLGLWLGHYTWCPPDSRSCCRCHPWLLVHGREISIFVLKKGKKLTRFILLLWTKSPRTGILERCVQSQIRLWAGTSAGVVR